MTFMTFLLNTAICIMRIVTADMIRFTSVKPYTNKRTSLVYLLT